LSGESSFIIIICTCGCTPGPAFSVRHHLHVHRLRPKTYA
jgi:hypothetical protein